MSFSSYKFRAKKKQMSFNVPSGIFEILKSRPCYYCKVIKDEVGVDRIDNTKGYISGNCVSSCWDCNRSKSNKTLVEYREYLLRFNPSLRFQTNPLVVHWLFDSTGEIHTRLAPHKTNLGSTVESFYRDDI